jgi:uncharacterized protein YndB with AHSA1/START domain
MREHSQSEYPIYGHILAIAKWSAPSALSGPSISRQLVYNITTQDLPFTRRAMRFTPNGASKPTSMSNSEFGTLVGGHTVHFERQFPGCAEYLWCFLTTRELLATWMGEGGIECRIGGAVRLHTAGSSISGVVTAVKPYSSLEYRWCAVANGGACDVVSGSDSFVTFKLQPQGGATRMVVIHSPIADSQAVRTLALWHCFLDRLMASVQQLSAEPFLRRFNRLLGEYESRMAPQARAPRFVPRQRRFPAAGRALLPA